MTIVLGVALIVALMLWTHAFRRRLEREAVLAATLAGELAEAFGLEPDESQAIVDLARNGRT